MPQNYQTFFCTAKISLQILPRKMQVVNKFRNIAVMLTVAVAQSKPKVNLKG